MFEKYLDGCRVGVRITFRVGVRFVFEPLMTTGIEPRSERVYPTAWLRVRVRVRGRCRVRVRGRGRGRVRTIFERGRVRV